MPITADKIVINHYYTKSREEYFDRKNRVQAGLDKVNNLEMLFEAYDRNEEFDDGILRYRAERAKNFQLPDKTSTNERLLNALMKTLSPTLSQNTPPNFYRDKMETFLTCRAVAEYLKTKLTDDTLQKFFEEASLRAILQTIASGEITFADVRIFLRELPTLLKLPYPVTKELHDIALQVIPQIMDVMHFNGMWKDFVELDYFMDSLKE